MKKLGVFLVTVFFLMTVSYSSVLAARGGSGGGSSSSGGGSSTDLSVTLAWPNSSDINTATVYTATVQNVSRTTAANVKLEITLPLTHTSPQVYILWEVSGLDSSCNVVSNKIVCRLGSMKRNISKNISFSYAIPVSTQSATIVASISSDTNDNNAGNDTDSFSPNLVYPNRVITSGLANNDHCTGTNLTSYYECIVSPSSTSSHDVTFLANGTIDLWVPGYTGTWSQATPYQLHFEYFENAVKVAEFDGYAINGGNCFDGITNFFPASGYNSAYRVCF